MHEMDCLIPRVLEIGLKRCLTWYIKTDSFNYTPPLYKYKEPMVMTYKS